MIHHPKSTVALKISGVSITYISIVSWNAVYTKQAKSILTLTFFTTQLILILFAHTTRSP